MKVGAIPCVSIMSITLSLATPLFAQNTSMPDDVRAFISRRDDCEHFRGEASDDAERQAEIHEHLQRLCVGSDAELARLLRHYAKDKKILKLLKRYDPHIETGQGG